MKKYIAIFVLIFSTFLISCWGNNIKTQLEWPEIRESTGATWDLWMPSPSEGTRN